ncbi:MAG: hypothetical protein LBP59_04395 [Planctomycetaceae bacterium]|jgi:uncharacterized Zn finger protein|nr:hypothetical protein [Planctomycetaceae bacterium]
MGYNFYEWSPYVPVSQRLNEAKNQVKKILGNKVNPITTSNLKIAKTFWGKAWCDNLESYSDYSNRMPRGRTYIRNGSVVHLQVDKGGKILAYVAGSDMYKIEIKIAPLEKKLWNKIKKKCAGEISSVVELLQGKLSKNVLAIVTNKTEGLFPKPKEIKFSCSCPDIAVMCKHVAATLYGVGVMLDEDPALFFKLRGVDHLELINGSISIPSGAKDADTLKEENLEAIFGVELADSLEDTNIAEKKKTTKKSIKKITKKTAKKTVKKTIKKVTKKSPKKTKKKTL